MSRFLTGFRVIALGTLFLTTFQSNVFAQRPIKVAEESVCIDETTENRGLKRKVAVGRFSNETQYAKGLFYDKENDPMGKQALDILTSRLGASGKFILLERSDIQSLIDECAKSGATTSTIGADYLIIGSVTEFGRKTVGKSNGFSSQVSQIVQASVSIRLVDASTGLIVYSGEGSGEATTTSKNNLLTSQAAAFDATLSDKAISAAIGQLVDNIISKCTDKPWRTFFLSADADAIIIAGGKSQGLNSGDEFVIKTKGKKVKNPQSGIEMTLPGKEIGKLRITETSGDTPETEFSFVEILTPELNISEIYSSLIIEEPKKP